MRHIALTAGNSDMENPFEGHPFGHQGVLLSFDTSISGNEYAAQICFELFPSPDAKRKQRFKWSFSGLADLVLTMSPAAMGKTASGSNIEDCKLYEKDKRLFMYLADGYIKFDFKEMETTKITTDRVGTLEKIG